VIRSKCKNLTEHVIDSGHWMAQERPSDVNEKIEAWLKTI